MKKQITVTVNGSKHQLEVPNRLLLVDFLRDELKLTGTHQACTFEGVCGACTVLLNNEAIKSCMMLAVQVDGQEITTIEGLGSDGELHPLQAAVAISVPFELGRSAHRLSEGFSQLYQYRLLRIHPFH